MDLNTLLDEHLQQFSNKKFAVKEFLLKTGLSKCFYEQPTIGELRVLIAKYNLHTVKEAAKELQLSDRTVEWYLNQLHNKTKFTFTQIVREIKMTAQVYLKGIK
jgi:hypothetical protein